MLNWFVFNAPLFNQAVAAASSIDTGSSRSPFGHIMVAVPDGDLLLIYQQGTHGLCYRRSTNGGSVWGSEIVISSRVDVYASAIINPTTLDVHVVYSKHGDPSTADLGVYYRPLIWDSGDDEWDVGGEQTLAGGGSHYDSATAGRHNASISVGDDGYPIITYLRNAAGVVTWAMLVSQEVWAFTDFDVDLDIGIATDEDSRGAAIQTDSRSIYFVSRTGSWYSLATTTVVNPATATGIDMTVLFNWLGAESEMVAVARNDDGDRLGIVYLAGDSAPHFRLYNLETYALVSDTEMDTAAADSVSITWDGAVFWMAWVANDIVEISNSDAPATVVQTFSNPGPDEDWSWLNSPVACTYTTNVIFVWCATASSIYTGVFAASRAVTMAETGAGVSVAQIEVAEAETGAGVDSAAVYDPINVADSGTGVETITAGPSVTDTGTGVDVGGKGVTIDETGAGAETVQISMTGAAETGAGSDSPSILDIINVTDTGTGADARGVGIAAADTGVGVDAIPYLDAPVAEVGGGLDTVVIELVGAAESGTGLDAMTAGIEIEDTGTGVDAPNATKPGAAETGVGADSAEIAMAVVESGSGADQVGAGNAIAVLVTDSGTGLDTPSAVWIPTATLIRLLIDSGNVRLKAES